MDLDAHVRKDDTLYDDFETEKAKAKRLEKEAKVEMQQEKGGAKGKKEVGEAEMHRMRKERRRNRILKLP